MASNSLLALLNLSHSGSSPSPSPGAPERPINGSTSPSTPPNQPPASNSSNVTVNSLLQSILSPPPRDQRKVNATFDASSSSSSPVKSSSAVGSILAPSLSPPPRLARSPPSASALTSNVTANNLLALLSGTGTESKKSNVTTEESAAINDTSFRDEGLRLWQQPIGTPPSNGSRSDLMQPSPPVITSNNTLEQILSDGGEKTERKTSSSTPKGKMELDSNANTLSKVLTMGSLAAPLLATSYTIDRKKNASHYLAGLHASAGFEDDISGGLSSKLLDGTQEYTLDLGAPQPAGPGSLYPAKLEITPISLLTTTFHPSCFVDESTSLSRLAKWPCQRVAGMGGKIIMYVMSKGRIRVLDQQSGARILARAESNIRTIFTGQPSLTDDTRWDFAATTEKGGLCVWSLENQFGQKEGDAPLLGQAVADGGVGVVHASWKPNSSNRTIVALQSDGQIVTVDVNDLYSEMQSRGSPVEWSNLKKVVIYKSAAVDVAPVGFSLSFDGSLLAAVEASETSTEEVKLHLRLISLSDSAKERSVALPDFSRFGSSNISFASLIDDAESHNLPQSLLIGFDDNQVIASFDLTTGSCRQVHRFETDGSSFSLARWHSKTSTLVLCCSLRSSIFTLRPRFTKVPFLDYEDPSVSEEAGCVKGSRYKQSDDVLYRIKKNLLPGNFLESRPVWKECALPEPYTSFAVDDTEHVQGAIRMLATHLGGIHSLLVPEEALERQVVAGEEEQVPEEPLQKQVEEPEADVKVVEAAHTNGKRVSPMPSSSSQEVPEAEQADTTLAAERKVEAAQDVGTTAQEGSEEVSSIPALPDNRVSAAGKKQSGGKKKGKNAKAAKDNAEEEDHPKMKGNHTDREAANNNEEVKAMLEKFFVTMTEQYKSTNQQKGDASTDIARLLADQLTPMMSSMINDVLRAELQQSIATAVSKNLPDELHNLLLRPELSNHLTRSITSAIIPPIQKTAMDVISRALAPHFEAIMNDLSNRMESKMEMGLTGIRKDIVMEQSGALLETEKGLNEMTKQMTVLTRSLEVLMQQNLKLEKSIEEMKQDQKKEAITRERTNEGRSSAFYRETTASPVGQTPLFQGFPAHIQTTNQVPFFAPPPATPSSHYPSYPPPPVSRSSLQDRSRQVSLQHPPFSTPAPLPLPSSSQQVYQRERSIIAPPSNQEVEDSLLSALSSPSIEVDIGPLRNALTSIESKVDSPLAAIWGQSTSSASGTRRTPAITQAVILTLLHRLVKCLNGQSEQVSLSPEMAVPWIEACSSALDKEDETISRFFEGVKYSLVEMLVQAHVQLKRTGRASWWTDERLAFGVLRFLQ
ncbi:hypothetical protein CBS101457_003946 [Exobasidium rhododendri]|nr:hypothetical protein CBS101457_003946 [Exobasidium rhododendri]